MGAGLQFPSRNKKEGGSTEPQKGRDSKGFCAAHKADMPHVATQGKKKENITPPQGKTGSAPTASSPRLV